MKLRILCVCDFFSPFFWDYVLSFTSFVADTAAFSGSVKVWCLLSLARTKCHNWTPLVFLLLPALLLYVQILLNSFQCTFPESLWHWCYHSPALVVGLALQPAQGRWTQFLMQTWPPLSDCFSTVIVSIQLLGCVYASGVLQFVILLVPVNLWMLDDVCSLHQTAEILSYSLQQESSGSMYLLRDNSAVWRSLNPDNLRISWWLLAHTTSSPIMLIFPSDATPMPSSQALLLSSGTNSDRDILSWITDLLTIYHWILEDRDVHGQRWIILFLRLHLLHFGFCNFGFSDALSFSFEKEN